MHPDFYCFWLTFLHWISPNRLHDCVNHFGNPKAFFEAKEEELTMLTERERKHWREVKGNDNVFRLWEELPKKDYGFLSCENPAYPSRLKELLDYPFGIYYIGALPPSCPSVGIVGARKATIYGQELAYNFAWELGRQGISVISGMASGIDGASHRGCMDAGGYTLGVLGTGINVAYPKENYNIYRKMQQCGGLITEYIPDTQPLPRLFPRRNRLISVLTDFLIVVEAREKSGSLITADFALEQGKSVGAVPGRPCDTLSQGCNRLIQQGAKCVLSAEDVLEELLDSPAFTEWKAEKNSEKLILGLAPKEKKVYSCLRLEPKFIDEILCQLDIPVWEGIQILTELEIKGIIRQNPHHYFYRTS